MPRPRTDALGVWAKLGLLASLYMAQGLPFGFFTQALPTLMRKQGYRLTHISYSALLALPWALKFLWAPLVDRHPRPSPDVRARRSRWIFACQIASSLAFIALAMYGRLDDLPPLFVAFAALNVISATQDIATDGLAVETLVGTERGYANGVQVAGYRAGMVIGGGVLLVILDRVGARAVFVFLAGLTIVLSIPLLLVREAPPRLEASPDGPRPRPPHFLTLRGVAPILLVIGTYKIAEALAAGVLKPFLADQGLSLADIGAASGIAGSTGGMLGALIGGGLASRIGPRAALIAAGVFQTVTVFLFALAALLGLGRDALSAICFIEAFASSMGTATLFTVMMGWCRPLVGATDYTVQASTVVIATGISTLASGAIAERLGYTQHFAMAGLIGTGTIFLLLFAYPRGAPTARL